MSRPLELEDLFTPLMPRLARIRCAGTSGKLTRLVSMFALVVLAGIPASAQFEEYQPEEEFWVQEAPPEEPPTEVAPESEVEEALLYDRISFSVPFPADKGGGTATGTAGHLEYLRDDYVVATGGVEVKYRDLEFQGQRVEINLKEKVLTAEGDVIIDQGPKRMIGDTLEYDLETRTGKLTNAKAFVDPDIYFEGEEIAKVGEDTYTVTRGLMTSCSGDSPSWSFRLSSARITMEGFARAKNARFRVKKMPLIYWPYIMYPAKTERTSGFLFPNIGYSDREGGLLGLAYFQTMGESADTTFFLDLYTEDFIAVGNEIRYRPNESTQGVFEGYAIDDPLSPDLRWKLRLIHTSDDLPGGFRGVVRYQDFSDFDFFRDFERDFNKVAIRRLRSAGYVTGSWGQQSFTFLVNDEETFVNDNTTVTKRRLPQAEYGLRATQIARLPVYLDLLSSVDYLSQERTNAFDFTYSRADLFPRLTFSLSTLPWLSASVRASPRATWYSDSLRKVVPAPMDEGMDDGMDEGLEEEIVEDTSPLSGNSLTRTFFSSSANVVGPSISRVFNTKIGRFSKLKHIVEPRWNYLWIDEFDEQDQVLQFDEIDRLSPTEVVGYDFVNRLLAKPENESKFGGAREIMSLAIFQNFSLDDKRPLQRSNDGTRTTKEGPIGMRYRFNPNTTTSLEAKLSYNTLFSHLNSTSLSAGTRFGQHALGTTWVTRFDPEAGDTRGNQLRFFAGIQLIRNRLRFDTQINYDFVTEVLQSQRYGLQISAQCFGVRLEYQELDLIDRGDKRFRFALSLKNIGTFLDLTGGTSTGGFNTGF